MRLDNIRVGTSGWRYRHWRGRFFPEDLSRQAWLAYYARRFNAVEVNSSFYEPPQADAVRHWLEQTPAQFQFAVKAPQTITHRKKLQDCADQTRRFLRRVESLGGKLGPILFQLPPRWRANPRRLRNFLEMLPGGRQYAFELRDHSWHTEEILALLGEHSAAFCIYDLDGFQTEHAVTADFVYVRLHGPSSHAGSYPPNALQGWERNARRWLGRGLSVYLFFDNDESGHAVKNARLLTDFLKAPT